MTDQRAHISNELTRPVSARLAGGQGRTLEHRSIDRLSANSRNARIHGGEQIEQLRASLREFRWTMACDQHPVFAYQHGHNQSYTGSSAGLFACFHKIAWANPQWRHLAPDPMTACFQSDMTFAQVSIVMIGRKQEATQYRARQLLSAR